MGCNHRPGGASVDGKPFRSDLVTWGGVGAVLGDNVATEKGSAQGVVWVVRKD